MIGDQPIYNTKDTIKLGSIKAFELLCEGADFFGMRRLQIEKFHWGDIQIVTDFKKNWTWKGMSYCFQCC